MTNMTKKIEIKGIFKKKKKKLFLNNNNNNSWEPLLLVLHTKEPLVCHLLFKINALAVQ